jgi:hypothetical protein
VVAASWLGEGSKATGELWSLGVGVSVLSVMGRWGSDMDNTIYKLDRICDSADD